MYVTVWRLGGASVCRYIRTYVCANGVMLSHK